MSQHKCSADDHDHSHHDHHHGHDHSHAHGHSHGHSHGIGGHHHHVPKSFGWRFAIGAGINMIFVGAEFFAGYMAQSVALMADAVHNLSDVVGLLLAWGASVLARLEPTDERTYGYRGASFLAATANAATLFLITGAIMFEAVQRFQHPSPIAGNMVVIVAGIGIFINTATAMLFWHGQKDDLNIRGAFLHMLGDALISFGVVVGAVAIRYTGYQWIDPLLGLAIAGIILFSTWGFATEALNMAMAAVPKHINTKEVRDYLLSRPGVKEVHDLHIWAMSTTETALTAHILRPDAQQDDHFLNYIAEELLEKFKIHHITIQVEIGNTGKPCHLAPAGTV